MVNKVEAEITALQADFAHTVAWLRGDYLPSPLPKVVEDRLANLAARFDDLREMVEDREATAASAATRDQEAVPDAVVGRLIDGDNPIRVWREYRGLSLRAVAARVGTSPSVLSDMETGKTEGRPAILRRIAGVLDVSLDELVRSAGHEADSAT